MFGSDLAESGSSKQLTDASGCWACGSHGKGRLQQVDARNRQAACLVQDASAWLFKLMEGTSYLHRGAA
jgi:hypothetical protein